MQYEDPLLRQTKIISAIGGETVTEYGTGTTASDRWIKTRSQVDGTKWKEAYEWYDGLGRTILTQSVDATDNDSFTATCYDQMGRVRKISNPVRSSSNPGCSSTLEWTEMTHDDLGRILTVKTPDNAYTGSSYSLSTSGTQIGTAVTSEDQAGKLRRSITNSLGLLVRVDEPNSSNELGSNDAPNQPTLYTYDVLGNLIQIQQAGDNSDECGGGVSSCSQTRSFEYDALSRLLEATSPESGTIRYTYDANNNVKTRWDERGIKTISDYDNLDRIVQRCYRVVTGSLGATTCAGATGETSESNTPDVAYYYDNLTNGKGRLIKVSSSISATEFTGFDPLGHVTSHKQTTDGVIYGNGSTDSLMTYQYSIGGALTEQQYPSGRKVRNLLNANGDLSKITSKKNLSAAYYHSYTSNIIYDAAGNVTSMELGNGRWESTIYNSRLQPTQISLGSLMGGTDLLKLDYSYGSVANNGNVLSQTITVPSGFTATQNYNYDSLNRLKDATESISSVQVWKQAFAYDRYGNRRFVTGSGQTTTLGTCAASVCNPSISPANNQPTSTGYSHDAAGNMTADASDQSFVYDGENRLVKAIDDQDQTIAEYSYDGDGRRVKKYVPSTGEVTVFVYDASGKVIAEHSTIVASTGSAQVNYVTNDYPGSPRINTDAGGGSFPGTTIFRLEKELHNPSRPNVRQLWDTL